MSIIQARLFRLSIPFNLTFSHGKASRSTCDSHILELAYGVHKGYGELIFRPYVNDPRGILDSDEKITARLTQMLEEFTQETPGLDRLRHKVLDLSWEKQDLPLLSAIETAMLDLLCRQNGVDIYQLLGSSPKREELFYGGILPILSDKAMEKILLTYVKMSIPYLRIKLARDIQYNEGVLKTARNIMGESFDIRVDVNCAWDMDTALSHFDLLNKYGITLVEEPMGADHEKMKILAEKTRGRNISYVADESAVTFADLDQISKDKTFTMLNLRIVKNGGLFRTLELSVRAESEGLTYQLGSHVGETGILSVMGRLAASLMNNPVYIDGSFDDYILSCNITNRSYTFGAGGRAPVIRDKYMGYTVVVERLGKGLVLL